MAPLSTTTVAHFLHPAHKLTMLYDDTTYICNGCMVVGEGTRFSCASCQFDLHEYCATCPTMLTSTKNHPHPMSLVVYKPKPNQTEACQICLRQIQGLVYKCESCSFLVHPVCALLKSGLNEGSAKSSSSSADAAGKAALRIGEHAVGAMAGKYMYDKIADNKHEVPTDAAAATVGGIPEVPTDAAAATVGGIPEVPTATADPNALGGIPEESGGLFEGMMSVIEAVFSSSSS